MRMLTSQSSRFTRSSSYTAPEHRPSSLRTARTKLSLVAPNHPVRGKDAPATEKTRQG
jgi:hypothetical protein